MNMEENSRNSQNSNTKKNDYSELMEDSYPLDSNMFEDIEADYNGVVDRTNHIMFNNGHQADRQQHQNFNDTDEMMRMESYRLQRDVVENADNFDIGRQQSLQQRFNSINSLDIDMPNHQAANNFDQQNLSIPQPETNSLNNFEQVRRESLKINLDSNEDTLDTQYSAIQQRIRLVNVAPKLSPQLQSRDFQPSESANMTLRKQSSEELQELAQLSQSSQNNPKVEADSTAENCCDQGVISGSNNENEESSTNQDDATRSNELYKLPAAYTGDGRKKEAKMVKNGRVTDCDEFTLDRQIRDYQATNPKILELEKTLDELKNGKPGKKGVQALRNKITAQLSRDRMKMEVEYLREQCSKYQRLMRLMHDKAEDRDFCDGCQNQIDSLLEDHGNKGIQIDQTRVNQQSTSSNKRQKVTENRDKKLTNSGQKPKNVNQVNNKKEAQSTQESEGSSTPTSSTGRVMILGKRNRAAAGALFCMVGMLGLVYDQSDSQQFNAASQALVEVKNEERLLLQMDESSIKHQPQCNCNKQSQYNDLQGGDSKGLQHAYSQAPNKFTDNYFSIDDAYMTYDMRDSYLSREPFSEFESQPLIQETMDWETHAYNLWNDTADPNSNVVAQTTSVDNDQDCNNFSNNKWSTFDHKKSLAQLRDSTSTIFCPTANMLVPFQQTTDENANKADVTLESDNEGNAYLHLILPADKINFLNGNSNFSFQNFTGNGSGEFADDEDYDQMLIEVGCKVYEVNRILYKSNPTDPVILA